MSDVAQRLRAVILEIRRKPYPISDLIPLLGEAAREIDALYLELSELADNLGLKPIKHTESHMQCNEWLHNEGKPMPRTCVTCKLGPCHFAG